MRQDRWLKIGGHATAITFAAFLLGSCAQLPDAINPMKWYDKSVDFFVGTENKEESKEKKQ